MAPPPDTQAPAIALSAPTTWGQTNSITANITDDFSGVDLNSFKWALGKNLSANFFVNNGNPFTGNSFKVTQNGDYTVFAKDNAGNISTGNVTVDYIISDPTIGNYTNSFGQISVNSPGITMNFGLTYNSNDKSGGPFGSGWTFSCSGSVKDYQYVYSTISQNSNDKTATLPELKVVKLPDGNTYTFKLGSNGQYVSFNSRNILTHNSDGSYNLVTPDKIIYKFNTNGYLSSLTDKNGNCISISVDSNGQINSVTDTVGKVYTLTYSPYAITLTDSTNKTITYTIGNGNLTSITDSTGTITNQFSYDTAGFLSNIKDGLNNNIASVSYDHGNKNRILSTTDKDNNTITYTYNDTDNSVTSTDVNNNQSITWYNNANQAVKLQDESGNKTFLGYDANGYQSKQAVPKNGTDEYSASSDQSLFNITTYQYDANGNLINTTYLDGTTEVYSYDSSNNLLTQKDKDGTMTYYNYDNKGNMTVKVVRLSGTDAYSDSLTNAQKQNFEITKYTYYSNGMMNVETDPDGTIKTYENNHVKTSVDNLGNVTTYNWDTTKDVLNSKIDPKGNTTSYTYDGGNNLTSVSAMVSGQQVTNTYTYENNKLKQINENGTVYNFTYDSAGNTTSVSLGNQNLISNTYVSDNSGKLLSSTYGNNQKISNDYDSSGRVTTKKYNDGIRNSYEYDPNGNLSHQDDVINGVNYSYVYDSANHLVGVTDSKGNNISFSYDSNNNINKTIDNLNGTTYETNYTFVNDGKNTSVVYNRDSSNNVIFGYDSKGKVTSSTVNTGLASFNSTISYITGLNGSTTDLVNSINNNGSIIGYTYDKNGNIATIIQNGQTISYYYNELNELIREDNQVINKSIVYSYDVAGNITSRVEYPYTTGTPSGAINTNSYVYGDANWKDKLTSFNCKDITYDAIGKVG